MFDYTYHTQKLERVAESNDVTFEIEIDFEIDSILPAWGAQVHSNIRFGLSAEMIDPREKCIDNRGTIAETVVHGLSGPVREVWSGSRPRVVTRTRECVPCAHARALSLG